MRLLLLITAGVLPLSLMASPRVIPNLNDELAHNKALIKEYSKRLEALKERTEFLEEQKAKHPKLYEEKPLYEETDRAYFYRMKLQGAAAKNIRFTVQNHRVSMEMNLKQEHKDEQGYYASSQLYYKSYDIPDDVVEDEIKNYVDGDYYVVEMPRK